MINQSVSCITIHIYMYVCITYLSSDLTVKTLDANLLRSKVRENSGGISHEEECHKGNDGTGDRHKDSEGSEDNHKVEKLEISDTSTVRKGKLDATEISNLRVWKGRSLLV